MNQRFLCFSDLRRPVERGSSARRARSFLHGFLVLGTLLGAGACSGGGGGGGGGGSNAMSITVCSLGCADSASNPGQISCNLTDVFVNQEVQVTFTQAIDPVSLNSNSFQMTEIDTGKTPP